MIVVNQLMHPAWGGNNNPFPEWCIKSRQRVRIVEIEIIDGVVDGDINLPNVDIRQSGTSRFKGNITAGNLIVDGHLTIG